jgi:hypothetical protein
MRYRKKTYRRRGTPRRRYNSRFKTRRVLRRRQGTFRRF